MTTPPAKGLLHCFWPAFHTISSRKLKQCFAVECKQKAKYAFYRVSLIITVARLPHVSATWEKITILKMGIIWDLQNIHIVNIRYCYDSRILSHGLAPEFRRFQGQENILHSTWKLVHGSLALSCVIYSRRALDDADKVTLPNSLLAPPFPTWVEASSPKCWLTLPPLITGIITL